MVREMRVQGFVEAIGPLGLSTSIDGGAGAGDTAREMLAAGIETVHAFEPFPGNHRFFSDDPRIQLHKTALAARPGKKRFFVRSVVREGVPGWEGRTGYSSLGKIAGWGWRDWPKRLGLRGGGWITVDAVRADDCVPEADFIKLDLQGGELKALLGMPRLLRGARALWIEFTGERRVLRLLAESGFEVFSTELMFREWSPWHEANLEKVGEVQSSIGTVFHTAFHGDWRHFPDEFRALRKRGLIQTDLFAVRP